MKFSRNASIIVHFSKEKLFPLLCPKMEEQWIPGWESDVLYSKSGYNEKGAVFKTHKAFGAEFIWFTQEYNLET